MRVGIVGTVQSPCQCAQSVAEGLNALGHEFILADSEEIELRASELARECDLVIDHTDTFRGRGIFRPLVRLLLEMEGARVVGSDSWACFLADDKIAAKARLGESGISVPPGIVIRSAEEKIPDWLKPPLVLKPAFEHMSRGLGLARSEEQARTTASDLLSRLKQPILMETFVPGRELAVRCLKGREDYRSYPPWNGAWRRRAPGCSPRPSSCKRWWEKGAMPGKPILPRPLLASDIPGNRGPIRGETEEGPAGLFFDPRDPEDFIKQALRLIDDPTLRNSLGRAGKRRTATGPGLKEEADGLIRAYEFARRSS